ncbi:MAG: hypothetical protein OEX07_07980, partial [Gammaproteobacteria bacterium]|nr:hypothetical protein [Gammaproteobacteria bacterium]
MCRSLCIDVYRNSCGVKVIQKTRSKVVLSIGFGAILIISLGMMANWLSYIQESTSRIEMILVEQEEANLVFEMRESAHQRFSLLFRIALLEDAFERDDKYIDFKAYATDFIRARDKLFSMGLTESEAALWADAKQAISLGGQVQQEAIELFL